MDNKKHSILIVDDDNKFCQSLKAFLEEDNNVFISQNQKELYQSLDKNYLDLILMDIELPDTNGMDEIKRVRGKYPNIVIIMLTALKEIHYAVESMRRGADDYLVKPVDLDELSIIIDKHFKENEIQLELDNLRSLASRDKIELIGMHPKIKVLKNLLLKISRSPINTILITGESGTGKEVVARFVHANSNREGHPFVVVNCPAIPGNLFESELFGFEKGSFTSASYTKKGLIEMANKGTLFFDEFSGISRSLQSKLLRFIEDRTIHHIGSNKNIPIDVTLIFATNKKLEQEIQKGNFREDLFFRINIMKLEIPPLRERKSDIPLLTQFYLNYFKIILNKQAKKLSKDAAEYLMEYNWPGNVRELRNAIERAVMLCDGKEIKAKDIETSQDINASISEGLDLGKAENKLNIQLINIALHKTDNNIFRAAKLLNIGRTALRYRIQKYNIMVKKNH